MMGIAVLNAILRCHFFSVCYWSGTALCDWPILVDLCLSPIACVRVMSNQIRAKWFISDQFAVVRRL